MKIGGTTAADGDGDAKQHGALVAEAEAAEGL
jgi:hypothetical protein